MPQLVFVSFLFVFIVVGNCCVLAAIQLSDNGRKTRMNFFITHLAIAGRCRTILSHDDHVELHVLGCRLTY